MINININLKADNAAQAIVFAEELRKHFGNDATMAFNAPSVASSASSHVKVLDIKARSKARLMELGLDRAPKATSKEMAFRLKYDTRNTPVNWSIDLVTRETVMRDDYSYDIYANNKGTTPDEAQGEQFNGEIGDDVPTED